MARSRWQLTIFFLAAIAAWAILYAPAWINKKQGATFQATGKGIPDVSLLDGELAPHRISEMANNRTVLWVLWATWCDPCVRELPQLELIREEFLQRKMDVYLVNYDQGEIKEVSQMVQSWLTERAIGFANYFDLQQSLPDFYNLVGLPALIGTRNGETVFVKAGEIDWLNKKEREKIFFEFQRNE